MMRQWLGVFMLLPFWITDPAAAQPTRLEELGARKIQDLSQAELGEFLTLKRQEDGTKPLNERTAAMAKLAIGQPSKLYAPLLGSESNKNSDCKTFVMQSIARAVAKNLTEHDAILKRLNYKGNSGDFLDTIFFTEDWIEENCWLWDDVTEAIAGEEAKYFKSYLRYRAFLYSLRFGQYQPGKNGEPAVNDNELGRRKAEQLAEAIRNAPSNRTVTLSYLPVELLENETITAQIKNGDVILLITKKRGAGLAPWFSIEHMGIANWNEIDQLCLIHSLPPKARALVLRERIESDSNLVGIKILRVKDHF